MIFRTKQGEIKLIKVLIVEDDPMVAQFNQKYIEEIEGFTVVAVAHSGHEALVKVNEYQVNLVLLDVFMPGQNGLKVLQEIRTKQEEIDVIFITAASDAQTIQQALRYGAIDYLIKPFTFERFYQALSAYKQTFRTLKQQPQLNQQELDGLLSNKKIKEAPVEPLPKGLTTGTLEVIVEAIEHLKDHPFSTDDVAEKTGISRVSIRKYLKFLTDIGLLGERMTYGTIGRPVYAYLYNEQNRHLLHHYLVDFEK